MDNASAKIYININYLRNLKNLQSFLYLFLYLLNEEMLLLLRAVNVDSRGMLCTRSIVANIISVSSHPRITIALRFTVIIHVPYGPPAYGPETPSYSFRVSIRGRREGGRKKKIAPKIECSRNKLNFAFGRSWNRVFVTYRCAFLFISFSLIRNFRRKCNIALRDAISKMPRCLRAKNISAHTENGNRTPLVKLDTERPKRVF